MSDDTKSVDLDRNPVAWCWWRTAVTYRVLLASIERGEVQPDEIHAWLMSFDMDQLREEASHG